jgi:uncharacterized protein (TIGR00730 family)
MSEKMSRFRRICVFCASAMGRRPIYREAAEATGKLLAERGIGLVYGGAKVGLMGVIADACLAAGGQVYGVIPHSLVNKELAHRGLTELYVVESMHARKTMMTSLADAFIALPGGFGTLEETFEITTWAQLGYHQKPIGLLDLDGYYRPVLDFCDRAVDEGLLAATNRKLIQDGPTPSALLDRLEAGA